jgi:hypothetical protein
MVLFAYALMNQDFGGKDLLHLFDSYPHAWAVSVIMYMQVLSSVNYSKLELALISLID